MTRKSEFLKHFPDLTWDFTPEVLEKRSHDLLGNIKKKISKITCLSGDKINFQSVCEPLSDIEVEMHREKSIIEVLFSTSPVDKVRDKCLELSKTWSDFFVEFTMRRDIYDLLTKVQSIENSLTYESARYLDKSLLYKRRVGLHLEDDVREKLTALMKNISNLSIDFSKNIYDKEYTIEFEKQNLLGMPDDFYECLTEKDGIFTVTLKDHHVVSILKHCKIIETRKIIETTYNSRSIEQNIKILEEILELRNQYVRILGYDTHADFVAEILMSKSAANVHQFLTSLFKNIQNALKKEMDRLLELKKKDCKEMMVPFDGKINQYDSSYYQNLVEKQDYHIDKNLIKEYFPFEHVTKQLLDIYQTLLGLNFEKVSDPPVIHPDVLLYAVYDKASKSLIGYFYLDLFPRPFKYGHAVCYGLQARCHYKNRPQLGCSVIIANFTKPLPDKPSLLTHQEIVTYFHEFGHVMHQICSKTRYLLFQYDFVNYFLS